MCPYYLDGDQARHCISAELGDNHTDVTTVQFSRAAGRRPAGFAGRSLKTQQHASAQETVCLSPGARSCRHARPIAVMRSELLRAIPRKEVIQPHLPVRLPCYDFTPVTSPTFDGSLPEGLGHRLRVLLTPVV